MSVRIVQITDTHLYRDPDGVLAGVSTWKTFRAVLRQIERQHGDFDYLILTGDLAQDEAFETYQMLREELGDWLERCRIIPGNHDDPANLRKVFPDLFSQDGGPLTFALSTGDWKIVGLDSHLPGETKGRIDANQLQWLRGELRMDPSTRTLLFVHYPPVAINVDWLDKIGLDGASELVTLIEASPQIKVICAGHVHQEYAGQIPLAAPPLSDPAPRPPAAICRTSDMLSSDAPLRITAAPGGCRSNSQPATSESSVRDQPRVTSLC